MNKFNLSLPLIGQSARNISLNDLDIILDEDSVCLSGYIQLSGGDEDAVIAEKIGNLFLSLSKELKEKEKLIPSETNVTNPIFGNAFD